MIPFRNDLDGWAKIETRRLRAHERRALYEHIPDFALGPLLMVLRDYSALARGDKDPDDSYLGILALWEQGFLMVYRAKEGCSVQRCVPEQALALRPVWLDGKLAPPTNRYLKKAP